MPATFQMNSEHPPTVEIVEFTSNLLKTNAKNRK